MTIEARLPEERGRDYALRMLRNNIISCELAPGSTVSENELAVQCGVSRTPVREAIIALTKIGAMEVYPQRSSRVSLIDYNLVDEAQFMRLVLECAVVEQLAANGLRDTAPALRENLDLQRFYENSAAPDAADKLFRLDNSFHRLLFEACNKQQIFRLMSDLELHFDRVRRLHLDTGVKSKVHQNTVSDHEAIYDAILRHDPNAARATMEYHLTRYRLDQRVLREKYPNFFV